MNIIAFLSLGCALLSMLSLLVLHFTSPEIHPGWRMVSEYALGKQKWLITMFFLLWGLSSFFLSLLLFRNVDSVWMMAGIILLIFSAAGEIMGGVFDVKHKLHGMAFGLGVPTLPVAALIISYQLYPSTGGVVLIWAAHLTWISLIVMAVAMGISAMAFKKAGIAFDGPMELDAQLPQGVAPIGGWANRFLVMCYIYWLIICSLVFL